MLGVTIFRGTERGRESFDDSGSICIKTSILNRNEYVRRAKTIQIRIHENTNCVENGKKFLFKRIRVDGGLINYVDRRSTA